MPSIRRSLIGYFLLLLGVALAAMGLVVDQLAREAMTAREAAERRRLEQEYSARQERTRAVFDNDLLKEARALGKELDLKFQLLFADEQKKVRTWTAAAGLSEPHNWLATVVQLGVSQSGPYRGQVFLADLTSNTTDDRIRRSFDEGDYPPYFQFHLPGPGGRWRVIRSPRQEVELPFDGRKETGPEPRFDSRQVAGAGYLRRVVVRNESRGNRFPRGGGGGPGGRGGPPPGGQSPGPPPPPADFGPFGFVPTSYVIVARPQTELTAKLDELVGQQAADLEAVADEAREGLARLRIWVAAIGGVTFLALAVGGPFMVRRGLRPVDRLSDAVGRVNERDFHLPVEPHEVGRELLPIHDRLTHTLTALRRAFDREKQAVADISHELRTPVAGLQATLDVSLRKPRTAEQYKATLEECRAITKQLGRLVERVLTLAQLDADSTPKTVPTDLADLTAGCVAVVRPLAEAHGLTVTADLHPGLSAVTDPDQVREVVMNLLSNAVEYNSPGGTVGVTAKPVAGEAVIEVRDTGIGMAPEVADRIFERFYRADPSRHATGAHSGLGLAIVKEAVAKLGGSVAVESEPGRGSTFRVRLPAPELAG